jgi:hypothetical protein
VAWKVPVVSGVDSGGVVTSVVSGATVSTTKPEVSVVVPPSGSTAVTVAVCGPSVSAGVPVESGWSTQVHWPVASTTTDAQTTAPLTETVKVLPGVAVPDSVGLPVPMVEPAAGLSSVTVTPVVSTFQL